MKFKNHQYYLNLVKENTTLNTEKETRIELHQKQVQAYNAKKNNFKTIFSKPQENWEEEAKKIIDGNPYLSIQWKLVKTEKTMDELDTRLKSGELSNEEKTDTQNQINDLKKEINEIKKEIADKIKLDLNKLNQI
jgi:hypothetical protein